LNVKSRNKLPQNIRQTFVFSETGYIPETIV